jgi:hypothetical protein
VSDYTPRDEPPRRRYSADEGQASPYDALGPPPEDDPMAALEQRLQSMAPSTPAAPAPAAAAPEARQPRPVASPPAPTRSRGRTRPVAAGRRRSTIARIAAPVVFLVAIIAVISLVYESGIVGGTAETPTPTPTKVTKVKKNGGQGTTTITTFKKYTVKDGDTLSGIAVKYDTTVNAILALNPDMSTSTLVVGTRIKVPRPSPSPSPSP